MIEQYEKRITELQQTIAKVSKSFYDAEMRSKDLASQYKTQLLYHASERQYYEDKIEELNSDLKGYSMGADFEAAWGDEARAEAKELRLQNISYLGQVQTALERIAELEMELLSERMSNDHSSLGFDTERDYKNRIAELEAKLELDLATEKVLREHAPVFQDLRVLEMQEKIDELEAEIVVLKADASEATSVWLESLNEMERAVYTAIGMREEGLKEKVKELESLLHIENQHSLVTSDTLVTQVIKIGELEAKLKSVLPCFCKQIT